MHLGTWRKSSYSGGSQNTNCVEVAWHKSSYSGGSQNTDCVEVATSPVAIGVRDSKNLPGPILTFPTTAWRDFLTRSR